MASVLPRSELQPYCMDLIPSVLQYSPSAYLITAAKVRVENMNVRAGRIFDKFGITSDDPELDKEGKDEDNSSKNWVRQMVNGMLTWVEVNKDVYDEPTWVAANKDDDDEECSSKRWVKKLVNGMPTWDEVNKIEELINKAGTISINDSTTSNPDKEGKDEDNSSKNWVKQMVNGYSTWVEVNKDDDYEGYSSERSYTKLVKSKPTRVKEEETLVDRTEKSMVATSENSIIATHNVHELAKRDQAFVAIFGLPIKGYPIQIYRTGGGTYFGRIGNSGLTDLGAEGEDDVKLGEDYDRSWTRDVKLLNWVPLGEGKIVEKIEKRELKIQELSDSEDQNIKVNEESKYVEPRGSSVKLVEWVEEKVKEIQEEIPLLSLETAPVDTTSTKENQNATENTDQVGGNTNNFGFTVDRGGTINMENVTNNLNFTFGNIDNSFVDIVVLKLAKFLEKPVIASIASILGARQVAVN